MAPTRASEVWHVVGHATRTHRELLLRGRPALAPRRCRRGAAPCPRPSARRRLPSEAPASAPQLSGPRGGCVRMSMCGALSCERASLASGGRRARAQHAGTTRVRASGARHRRRELERKGGRTADGREMWAIGHEGRVGGRAARAPRRPPLTLSWRLLGRRILRPPPRPTHAHFGCNTLATQNPHAITRLQRPHLSGLMDFGWCSPPAGALQDGHNASFGQ